MHKSFSSPFLTAALLSCLLLVLLLCGSDAAAAAPAKVYPYPLAVPKIIQASGSHYEVGFTVGKEAKALIAKRLSEIDIKVDFLPWVHANADAQAFNKTLFANAKALYPELIEELQGVAAGSGVGFEGVWILNTIDEMIALYQSFTSYDVEGTKKPSVHKLSSESKLSLGATPSLPMSFLEGHSTDIFSAVGNPDKFPMWGHNDDSGLYDVNLTYYVNATIYNYSSGDNKQQRSTANDAEAATKKPEVKHPVAEQFFAFAHPGTVAGKAYGWNRHGVIFTCDGLFAKKWYFGDPKVLPRAFQLRAAYRASSVDEAIKLASTPGPTTSFSLNVASIVEMSAVVATPGGAQSQPLFRNVEVAPGNKVGITQVYGAADSTMPPLHAPPHRRQAEQQQHQKLQSPGPNELKNPAQEGAFSAARLPQALSYFYHTNSFLTLNTPAFPNVGSDKRLAKLVSMPPPAVPKDINFQLGDVSDKDWPVYRFGIHGVFTMSTAIFDFEHLSVELYFTNPKTAKKPHFVIPMMVPQPPPVVPEPPAPTNFPALPPLPTATTPPAVPNNNSKHIALIVGLAIGIPGFLILVFVCVRKSGLLEKDRSFYDDLNQLQERRKW